MGIVRDEQFAWTERAVELLKQQWAAGLSASAVAGELGREFGIAPTRSAVCGKINRLGLSNTGPRATRILRLPRAPRAPHPFRVARLSRVSSRVFRNSGECDGVQPEPLPRAPRRSRQPTILDGAFRTAPPLPP
jgi:hypothetical protein